MSRTLLAGSILNKISGSMLRYPAFKVLVWNPLRVDIGDLAAGRVQDAPLDLTAYVEQVQIQENAPYEQAEQPSPTRATITFRKNIPVGTFKRGFIADGVIVRILEGDRRVRDTDWVPVFTGTFRGRSGENKGTRADHSEGFTANALGREERYMSAPPVTTDTFPAGTDVGIIAYNIAWKWMGLGEDEILFGTFGFILQAVTNQIVNLQPLDALYQCMFPVGKKPKFDALGRLCAIDVNLDKPAARIYTAGSQVIESLIASPNDIEVNNQVILRGLDHNMTKVVQDAQVLDTIDLTTGFFDAAVKRSTWFSPDHSQKAQETYLVARHSIAWSKARWTEVDEFHGEIRIDTHFLRDVRLIIFVTYLSLQLAVAAIDLVIQEIPDAGDVIVINGGVPITLAVLRSILQVTSQIALAGLLWSMNYIGRGEYEVWGKPFEFVYQELVSDNRLVGLDDSELRAYDYRNDFISDLETLDAIGRQRLRRELLKNQTYQITMLFDPLLEVDDVIEIGAARYYIQTVDKTFKRGQKATMTLTALKVFEPRQRTNQAVPLDIRGYGDIYADEYGEAL